MLSFVCNYSNYCYSFGLTKQDTSQILPCFEKLVPHSAVEEIVSDGQPLFLIARNCRIPENLEC
jgi:hypothetical protein